MKTVRSSLVFAGLILASFAIPGHHPVIIALTILALDLNTAVAVTLPFEPRMWIS
jgi:hypothetical protein